MTTFNPGKNSLTKNKGYADSIGKAVTKQQSGGSSGGSSGGGNTANTSNTSSQTTPSTVAQTAQKTANDVINTKKSSGSSIAQTGTATTSASDANQVAYLKDLASKGGGNGEWAKAQLKSNYGITYSAPSTANTGGTRTVSTGVTMEPNTISGGTQSYKQKAASMGIDTTKAGWGQQYAVLEASGLGIPANQVDKAYGQAIENGTANSYLNTATGNQGTFSDTAADYAANPYAGTTTGKSSTSGGNSTANQIAYLKDLEAQGGGNAVWAKVQLAKLQGNTATTPRTVSTDITTEPKTITGTQDNNQVAYLKKLADAGGGNGEWAKAQLKSLGVNYTSTADAENEYQYVLKLYTGGTTGQREWAKNWLQQNGYATDFTQGTKNSDGTYDVGTQAGTAQDTTGEDTALANLPKLEDIQAIPEYTAETVQQSTVEDILAIMDKLYDEAGVNSDVDALKEALKDARREADADSERRGLFNSSYAAHRLDLLDAATAGQIADVINKAKQSAMQNAMTIYQNMQTQANADREYNLSLLENQQNQANKARELDISEAQVKQTAEQFAAEMGYKYTELDESKKEFYDNLAKEYYVAQLGSQTDLATAKISASARGSSGGGYGSGGGLTFNNVMSMNKVASQISTALTGAFEAIDADNKNYPTYTSKAQAKQKQLNAAKSSYGAYGNVIDMDSLFAPYAQNITDTTAKQKQWNAYNAAQQNQANAKAIATYNKASKANSTASNASKYKSKSGKW